MMLVLDKRRRVTLPKSFKAGQPLGLEPLEDGTFRLVPIPAHQLWAWGPEAQLSVAEALKEYHDGKTIALDSPEGQALIQKLGTA